MYAFAFVNFNKFNLYINLYMNLYEFVNKFLHDHDEKCA